MTEEPFWTDAVTERCKKLWLAGHSASQCAKMIGAASRNAVIGKMAREGCKRPDELNRQARREAGKKGARTLQKARKAAARRAKPRKVVWLAPELPVGPVDLSLAKPWSAREFGECAYPVGGTGADTLSCCNPTGGGVYCHAHRQVVFSRATAA